MKKLIAAGLVLGLYSVDRAVACTTFCLQNGTDIVFGKNYDWNVEDGLVFVNKRNVQKTAMDGGDPAASWVSKYGSVTFNQFGREQPNGGMNEAGLIVELMWLNVTQYPEPDARSALGCLEWIQYQLDHYSTVDEVVAAQSEVRIGSTVPIHYLVCDRNGKCATIEFLGGKFVHHAGKDLPQQALTNDTYEASIEHLRQFKGFGGDKPIPQDDGSLSRFVIASAGVQGFESAHGKSAIDYAFDVLHRAAQGSGTKWSIVYDPKNLQAHFRTLGNPKVRSVDLKEFDLSCQTPVRMLDMAENLEGPVTARFVDYSLDKNRALIDNAFSKVDFLAALPVEERDATARHPDSMACTTLSSAEVKASSP